MAPRGVLAVIVLCYASVALAADADSVKEAISSSSSERADQRLFVSDGTQVTVSTDTLAFGVLLLGLIALGIVILPLLLGDGGEAAATAYDAPSTYAQDPYSARSVRSTFNILKALDKAATKFL